MAMIYIIINQSHEWDEHIDEVIEFVSTSIDEAESIFDKYYSCFSRMRNEKWCFSADLREYPDGYCFRGIANSKFKVIKHVDNLEE